MDSTLLKSSVDSQNDVLLPAVSIVIPCLNEETTIGPLITAIEAHMATSSIPFEVVVSDNGSTDRSVEVALNAGARVVYAENRGYGSALQRGISAARGTVVVMLDADLSYDPAFIPRLVEPVLSGRAEMVIGSRLTGAMEEGAMPFCTDT